MHHLRSTLLALLACAPLACAHQQAEGDTARVPNATSQNSPKTPNGKPAEGSNETASLVTDQKDAGIDASNECAPTAAGSTDRTAVERPSRSSHNTE
jgi:hypothetical protein